MVFVSFGQGCDPDTVKKAARSILRVPLLTLPGGVWGDGSATRSVSDIALMMPGSGDPEIPGKPGDAEHAGLLGLMIIPTASLTSKIKGKYLSYRDQCNKDASRAFYNLFVRTVRDICDQVLDAPMAVPTNGGGLGGGGGGGTSGAAAAAVPPHDFFKVGSYAGVYSQFSETGLPIVLADGAEVSKSQRKKLQKLLDKAATRWEKHLAAGGTADPTESVVPAPCPLADKPTSLVGADGAGNSNAGRGVPAPEISLPVADTVPDEANEHNGPAVRVVAGTFGNRQGLRLNSELGPFTHTFTF